MAFTLELLVFLPMKNRDCVYDPPIKVDCYQHGGILPFVLRELMANA